jgi:hypothetical protein
MSNIKYEVLSKIFIHCVKENTEFFHPMVAYKIPHISRGNVGYALRELREDGYIKLLNYTEYKFCCLNSLMRYIGKVLRKYYSIAPSDIKVEIKNCIEENGLDSYFMDFILLNKLNDEEICKFLDLTDLELKLLLNYIDLNLCKTAIKKGIQLPFSEFLSNN